MTCFHKSGKSGWTPTYHERRRHKNPIGTISPSALFLKSSPQDMMQSITSAWRMSRLSLKLDNWWLNSDVCVTQHPQSELLLTNRTAADRVETKPWLEATRKLHDLRDPTILPRSQDKLIQFMIMEVQNSIARAMRIEWTERLQGEMGKIFAAGLELLRLLHRQPALYFVQMVPACEESKPLHFDANAMEEVERLEDPHALAGRYIEISVFPLVYKKGGEGHEAVCSIPPRVTIVQYLELTTLLRPSRRRLSHERKSCLERSPRSCSKLAGNP